MDPRHPDPTVRVNGTRAKPPEALRNPKSIDFETRSVSHLRLMWRLFVIFRL